MVTNAPRYKRATLFPSLQTRHAPRYFQRYYHTNAPRYFQVWTYFRVCVDRVKNYPWAKFGCESASIGNIFANMRLRRGNTPGAAAERLPFRDWAPQWQATMLVYPLLLAHLSKTNHFGVRVVSRIFGKKKHVNARGFAREFLLSCMLYRPGKSIKKRSQSSRLDSKKIFCLGSAGCLWVTS